MRVLSLIAATLLSTYVYSEDHAGLPSNQELGRLYHQYEQSLRSVRHQNPDGSVTMSAKPPSPSQRNELRRTSAQIAKLRNIDITGRHLNSAKSLLTKLRKGERLLLRIALDSPIKKHWDVVEVGLSKEGKVIFLKQFGLDPAAPSNIRETRSQWVARENAERGGWPDKYLIEDWKVVPRQDGAKSALLLNELRDETAAVYNDADYFPLIADCDSAACYFWDRLPKQWIGPQRYLSHVIPNK